MRETETITPGQEINELPAAGIKKRRIPMEKRALKWLAGFLGIMVLLTLLSRAADSLTVAQVTLEAPRSGTLTHRVFASGKLEAEKEVPVIVPAGYRVESVAVQNGQTVKEGDILIRLDQEDLSEQLLQLETELRKLEISKELLRLGGQSAQSDGTEQAQRTLEQAQSELEEATEHSALAVERAQKDLEEAQAAYEIAQKQLEDAGKESSERLRLEAQQSYERENRAYQETCLSAQNAIRAAERQVEDAAAALERIGADPEADAFARTEAQRALRRAQEDEKAEREKQGRLVSRAYEALLNAQNALNAADRAAEEPEFQSAKAEMEAALSALESRKRALEDAQRQAKTDEKSAIAAVEQAEFDLLQAEKSADSAQKAAADERERASLQLESAQMDLTAKQRQAEKLQSLLDAGGAILSPVSGTVLQVGVSAGERTADAAAVLLADAAGGVFFHGALEETQAKYAAVGAKGKLSLAGKKNGVEVTIDVLAPRADDENALEAVCRLPEGDYPVGASATLDASQKTDSFSVVISAGALRSDGAGEYVLILQERKTVLGTEWIAARANVTVIEQDGQKAAVEGISRSNQVIVSSTKILSEGDRVRLRQS